MNGDARIPQRLGRCASHELIDTTHLLPGLIHSTTFVNGKASFHEVRQPKSFTKSQKSLSSDDVLISCDAADLETPPPRCYFKFN
ncbi:hypothetical protein CLAIMM_00667 [Cladophialophora immunda]|nr:hypothetical protein CLAIMM_00667 [Cladophialophora immunda]